MKRKEKYIMKKIKYDDIKTPATVEEFRTNLKKYFCCVGEDRNYLFTQFNQRGWDINSLHSLSDLYFKELNAGSTATPNVIAYVDTDMNKLTNEEIMKHWGSRNFESIMKDESRFKIYNINTFEHHSEYFGSNKPKWYGIDNQLLRSFYMKTLGDFSGYKVSKLSEVA